ncbi:hypothetical protein AAFF_G00113180 [Aldrovandia affinis]|uniref:Uncharacterized protein n=1 Tax=Aldrovandia affinis TaxID=143900 RepID=A0AAD7WBH7_9TELE|nr:hypothetical protein AAFF_G00113180 [Aldrovandia affinis]
MERPGLADPVVPLFMRAADCPRPGQVHYATTVTRLEFHRSARGTRLSPGFSRHDPPMIENPSTRPAMWLMCRHSQGAQLSSDEQTTFGSSCFNIRRALHLRQDGTVGPTFGLRVVLGPPPQAGPGPLPPIPRSAPPSLRNSRRSKS